MDSLLQYECTSFHSIDLHLYKHILAGRAGEMICVCVTILRITRSPGAVFSMILACSFYMNAVVSIEITTGLEQHQETQTPRHKGTIITDSALGCTDDSGFQ